MENQPQRSRRWLTLGWILRIALTLVPMQARFWVILRCAQNVRPFLESTRGQKAWAETLRIAGARQFDGPAESALYLVCEKLSSLGLRFDPQVEWQGLDALASAYEEGKGVLLIGPHTMLCKFALRWMHDRKMRFSIFAAAPVHIPGAAATADLLLPSTSSMLRARSQLLDGFLVGALIDRKDRAERRNVEVATAAGPLRISDGLIKLALRCNSRIVLMAAGLNSAGIPTVRFGPAPVESNDVHSVVRGFAEFVTRFAGDEAIGAETGALSQTAA